MNIKKIKYQKSFTLIELLVVIAIIGGLSSLLVPNYMAARERARDAQRKSDIKQLRNALELYKLDQTTAVYPAAIPTPGGGAWVVAGSTLMNKVPSDPTTNSGYTYIPSGDYMSYNLCACLENIADPESSPASCTCPSGKKAFGVTQP